MKSTHSINNYVHFLIYKITNNLNGRIYVGLHQTLDENDDYMGSGKLIIEDIKKLGRENFTKEILYKCSSAEEMERMEEAIVTPEFLNGDVYNQMPGGKYGSPDRNGLSFLGKTHDEKTRIKIGESSKGRTFSEKVRKKLSENNFARRNPEAQRIHAARAGAKGGKAGKGKKKSLICGKYKGEKSYNFGLKREKVQCPYCSREGAKNTMIRWHFDNCKVRVRISPPVP